MTLMYMRGTTTIAITQFAAAIPRVKDKVAIGNRKFEVIEIVWHIDNNTWVEVQI